MSIKSTPEGYLVDIRPQGREGKRIRKRFKTKSEAQQFERWVIATEHNKEWVERPADNRTLTELIETLVALPWPDAEVGGKCHYPTVQIGCGVGLSSSSANKPPVVCRVSGAAPSSRLPAQYAQLGAGQAQRRLFGVDRIGALPQRAPA